MKDNEKCRLKRPKYGEKREREEKKNGKALLGEKVE